MTKWYHDDSTNSAAPQGTEPMNAPPQANEPTAEIPPVPQTPFAPQPMYAPEEPPVPQPTYVPETPYASETPYVPETPFMPEPSPVSQPAYAPEEPPVPETPYVPEEPPVPPAPPVPPTPPVPPAPSYPTGSYYGVPRASYMPPAPQPPAPQPPKKKRGNAAVVVLSVICAVSVLVCCVLGGVMLFGDEDRRADVRPDAGYSENEVEDNRGNNAVNEDGPTLQISDANVENDGGLSTSEIVARNLDATVVLTMYQQAASIHEFYGYSFGSSSELVKASEASGIVMSEDGYIITNSHCVFDEESQREYARIDVTMYDGTVYESVDIVGYDPTTDLAVIKVDAKNLDVAEFGDSSALSLGDRVVTLGNSGGLQWSVSQGILSGQARDVYEDTGYAIKCLQVDAIINPGSSGGPLINAYGQVVGVNSAKIVLTGYEGLGFSIPINEAKEVIDDLIKYGYVTGRVALGITGRTITSIGYEGFMIDEIAAGSAFEGTAVRAGDIITHVNGKRVMDYTEMRTELTSHEVGDTISLTLIRLNQQTRQVHEYTVDVTLKESK